MKDFDQALAKVRRVALYSSIEIESYHTIWEVSYRTHDENYPYAELPESERTEKPLKGYVRISEPVEMTFQPLHDDQVIQNAVAALDAEEHEAVTDHLKRVAKIRERKAQLLAISFKPEVA